MLIAIHDRALTLRNGRAKLAGGAIRIDASQDEAGLVILQVGVSHLTLGELPAFHAFVSGVPVDIAIKLRSNGSSLHALAVSASGRVQIRNGGPGVIRHGFEEVGDNLVYHFMSAFEAFRRSGSEALLECVAVDLAFHNGVALAKNSMALRTRRLHVRGGGRVDLNDESLDLVFKPEARSTIKLQSLKAVEKVRVRGPFAAPEIRLDSARLVGRAARFGLDVANLGGGAVFNRLLRGKSKPGLCAGAPGLKMP